MKLLQIAKTFFSPLAKCGIDSELEEECKFPKEAKLDNNPSAGPVTVG